MPHYKLNYEPIDLIEELNLNFSKGNVVKYVTRAGNKIGESAISDLEKAKYYVERDFAYSRKGEVDKTYSPYLYSKVEQYSQLNKLDKFKHTILASLLCYVGNHISCLDWIDQYITFIRETANEYS